MNGIFSLTGQPYQSDRGGGGGGGGREREKRRWANPLSLFVARAAPSVGSHSSDMAPAVNLTKAISDFRSPAVQLALY